MRAIILIISSILMVLLVTGACGCLTSSPVVSNYTPPVPVTPSPIIERVTVTPIPPQQATPTPFIPYDPVDRCLIRNPGATWQQCYDWTHGINPSPTPTPMPSPTPTKIAIS